MKSVIASISFTVAFLLSGCVSPNADYVKRHPELTAAQKKMFLEKEIYAGTDVAGLTKEQIRQIMGKEPTQYTKAQGVDAWVYEKMLPKPNNASAANASVVSQMGIDAGILDPNELRTFQVTTILFNGDIATRAERTLDHHPQ